MTTPRLAPMDRLLPSRGLTPLVAMMLGLGVGVAAILGAPRAAQAQSKAKADGFYMAVVTGDDVYVRSGGADSYYPFGKVQKGAVVKVIGEKHNWARVLTTGPAFRDFFAYIRYPKSDEGRFEVDATGRKGRTLGLTRALAPNLNTNYEPDDSWKRILLIEAETELEVLETTQSERAVVHKIVMPQNAEGWISTAFLQPASGREIAAWEAAIERSALLAAGALPGRDAASARATSNLATSNLATSNQATSDETTPPELTRPLGAAGPEYQAATGADVLARGEEVVPTMPEPLEEILTDTAGTDTAGTEADDMLPLITTTTETVPPVVIEALEDTTPWTEPVTNGEPIVAAADETAVRMADMPSESMFEPIQVEPVQVPESNADESFVPVPEPSVPPTTPTITMGEAETTDLAMPKPAAPPSLFDRIAASIRNKAPKDALADLESAYQRLRSEPIETAEVLPLRHLYRTLASTSGDDREVARYAEARAEQLTIWADLQQRRAELERIRSRLEITSEETEAARIALEQSGTYAAVGRLAVSTVYDGVRLPRLYRVQDSVTGRTILYLKPDSSFDLPGMLGQVIGVIGRPAFEQKLRLNLVEPKRIDLLAQAG